MTVCFLIFSCCVVPAEKYDLKFGHSILQEQLFQQGEDICQLIFNIPENGDIQWVWEHLNTTQPPLYWIHLLALRPHSNTTASQVSFTHRGKSQQLYMARGKQRQNNIKQPHPENIPPLQPIMKTDRCWQFFWGVLSSTCTVTLGHGMFLFKTYLISPEPLCCFKSHQELMTTHDRTTTDQVEFTRGHI